MEYRILGPLEVLENGRQLSLGGTRQRALLALLLLHPNEVLSTDRLLDELWGAQPPESGAKAVQVLVSQLRKALQDGSGGDVALETRAPGYVLRVEEGELDRERFDMLAEKARDQADPERRAALLREALGLWRGAPLADLSYESFAQASIARLGEARLAAVEDRIDADLALGRHSSLTGELEELVARHPLRERLRGQLMLALYRSGRQADALAAYQDARDTLVGELGVEPSPELRALHKQILAQDPALSASRRGRSDVVAAPGKRPRRGRRLLVGAAVAAAAVAAVAAILFTRGSGQKPIVVNPDSVAVIDPASGHILDAIPVGDSPGPIVPGGGALWLLNLNDRTLTKIDPRSESILDSVAVPVSSGRDSPSLRLAASGTDVWVWACHLTLFRVDPANTQIVQQLEIFRDTGAFAPVSCAVASDPGSVWVPLDEPKAEIVRIGAPADAPASVAGRFPAPPKTWTAMALGAESLWLVDFDSGALRRMDPRTGRITGTLQLGEGPVAMAAGDGALWVANVLGDAVLRIDPRTNAVVRSISVGDAPTGVAIGSDGVWVANSGDGTVSRIDPETNSVAATIDVGHRPQGVAVTDGRVWVTVRG